MQHCNKFGLHTSYIRLFSKSSNKYTSHYDVLGVSKNATQSDIKSAYYKLSKVYHPDKSKNDEASAKKFRSISEAYEILGNVKLKRMYDKGLMVGRENTSRMDYEPEPEPTDPTLKFYKSREKRHIVCTVDGKTPVYDFDSWSKAHYGEVFKKQKLEREFIKKQNMNVVEHQHSKKQELVVFFIVFVAASMILLSFNSGSTFDIDHTQQNSKNSSEHNKTM